MSDNGAVSARTKIVLSPAQLAAIITLVIAAVLYFADMRIQMVRLTGAVEGLGDRITRLERGY